MASNSKQQLSKIQINRLQEKLSSLIAQKENKWLKKNPKPQPMSLKERVEAIKSGKAKLKPTAELEETRYLYLKDAFTFPGEAAFEKLEKKHLEARNEFVNALVIESERIMDQAIFISCEAALEMIQKFEAYEP